MKSWYFIALLLLALVTPAGSFASKSTAVVTPEPVLAGGTVTISNFQFTPKVVRIKAGGSVTWQVKEGTHTVSADDASFASSTLSAGQKFSYQFDMAGTVIVSR
jgi:plastocyanin